MTTDADKIRDAFEAEFFVENLNLRKSCGKYGDSVVQRMWNSYFYAYKRGQRDLIEAMGEPVAWLISYPSEPDLGHWIAEENCSDLDGSPLYRLPEDMKK